jgi:two-component system, NarL family, sensor kinase
MREELQGLHKNIQNIIIFGSIVFLILGLLIISFISLYQRRKNKMLLEKEQMQATFQQTLLKSQLEIQEQTLKTISQEIHDNIGQALTLAKLNLSTMLPVAGDQFRDKIINSKELVSKAIGDLRDLSRSLDTDYVKEMGLQRAIEYELEMIQKSGTILTSLKVDGPIIRLEKQKELILFRIIQECFHNVIKHAETRTLEVGINYDPRQINIGITDNGKGMDLTSLREGNNPAFGLGIRNMHNRAKLISAQFNMSSILDKGTTVRIIIPLENNDHENNH